MFVPARPTRKCLTLPARGPAGGAARGVTLIELLIVLLILLMVTAAAIPIIAPATRNREMREASRLVSSYFTSARIRAIQTGRPVGVMVERFNGQPFAFQLSQVEVPPPYSGDTFSSVAAISLGTPVGALSYSATRVPTGTTPTPFLATFQTADFNFRIIRVGDQIQFGNKGPMYTIFGPDEEAPDGNGIIDDPGGGATEVVLDIAHLRPGGTPSPKFPWTNTPPPPATSYQVTRQPSRSLTPPLQLPEGIVVDLVSSGSGTSGTFNVIDYSGTNTGSPPPFDPLVPFDPVILFSPTGRLEAVSQTPTGVLRPPIDAVYLLLGRRELMYDVVKQTPPANQDIVDQNLSPVPTPPALFTDPTTWPAAPPHFWVAIGYQTGQVSVAELAPNMQDYAPSTAKPLSQVIAGAIGPARRFARDAQSVGGQ